MVFFLFLSRLHELSFTEIKSIIEIKNPKSKIIIEKLIRNEDYKTQDVIKMGFS